MSNKIAYIVSRFPHLPETFILREMISLEQLGWRIELYPLIIQRQEPIHAEARPWLARARAVPWISFGLLKANFVKLLHQPRQYISLFWRVVRENFHSPKFLVRALLLFPRAVWMADQFKADNIEHIHAHYATHPGLVAWLIHRLTGIPYSITVHAHDIFVEKAMLATKLHDSVFVSAISEFNRQYLVNLLGPWIQPKTQIIRCGIDPACYGNKNGFEIATKGRLELISVGSLQPYKGQMYLVKACKELHKRGIPFRCRIVGGGEMRPLLERAIREHQLSGLVELTGPRTQEQVSQLLPTANCYVQPSVITSSGKMEGIPVAIMEAMASGIPVVATSISGIPELVRHGDTGWLVPPEDAEALTDALEQVYHDPTEAHKRAQAAKRWVLAEFELDSNVKKLSSLFAKASLFSSAG
jgi:colanic acid/amylovoran biosynthesis glycosyltransferase